MHVGMYYFGVWTVLTSISCVGGVKKLGWARGWVALRPFNVLAACTCLLGKYLGRYGHIVAWRTSNCHGWDSIRRPPSANSNYYQLKLRIVMPMHFDAGIPNIAVSRNRISTLIK